MKNIFLIQTLLISLLCFSQNQECIVYLKDGTSKGGISRFKNNNDVKFRETKVSEPEIIPKEKIDKIKLDENGIIGIYRYKNVKDEVGLWLKEIASVGEVCLYIDKISGSFYATEFNTLPTSGINNAKMYRRSKDMIYYYVCHKTETNVLKITSTEDSNSNFKKVASEFFKDCPKLVDKIQSKEYQKKDIESVIWFYNNYCMNK